MLHFTQVQDRDSVVYDKSLAPKCWLGCTLPGELEWHIYKGTCSQNGVVFTHTVFTHNVDFPEMSYADMVHKHICVHDVA